MKKEKVIMKIGCAVILMLLFCLSRVAAVPCSDVNSGGAIDIVNALLVTPHYVGLNPANFDSGAADVNGDSGIDIVDALLIAQYYVGLITSLPGCEKLPEVTYELQAEDTAIWDNATVDSDNAGFTGSGLVNTENVSNTWIEWSFDVTQACNAVCVLSIRMGGTDNRPMDVSVNGSYVINLSFPKTSDWTTCTTQTAEVALNPEPNTIRLTATSDNGGPNIDKMDIT
jgi:hypothetical protein